jgi:hypothetical protein
MFPITQEELDGIRADSDQQLFPDEGVFERITDLGTLDAETAAFTGETRLEIYSGPCFIYPIMSRRDRFDEFGQGLIFTRQYRVGIPYDSDPANLPQIRDRFHVTTATDGAIIGREFEVRDVVVSTLLGYRRITVQDTEE